ncbi:open rectifier potassium channel protein 1 [Orussus abietinus]|uniref:open rectifier potassium channel protein 1 n=1 Tax=Orussus abietinus TaxID=222816 RepID=UPI00062641D9|nr:open rectifier potassium channel protein 1 [Orussus abietinus]
MSKRQWMVLLMLFLTYLLLGASIFYHIESRLEVEKVRKARMERMEINALLHQHYVPDGWHDQHEILEKLTSYCGKSVYNYTEGETDPLKWDFYNSFYFAYTVVSTIGYGNLAPTNMLGRILMIFYGLVGIPMNGILLTQLGEFFGNVFVRAHQKYKSYNHGQSDSLKKSPLETRKASLAVRIFMYLIPGFVMFIFFPAFLFSHFEGWGYDEAVYYAFVTLTTIGFGDYVAGQDNTKGSGIFFILYKTFLICWISFGLGYIVMIMTFIARGMRSKKITRLERKLAMNLKHTQSRIWHEFNKEVNYLRRVFNELQLSKVKRVYVDEVQYQTPPSKFTRSNSFPDLRDLVYGGLANPIPPHPRRRANSEVVPMETQVTRVVSETDLQRIDKTATFASHAMVQPAELLARLVNVLGYIPPPPGDLNETADQDHEQAAESRGVQGFSEKDILASERSWNESSWKIGGEKITVPRPRSRASSEVRLNPKMDGNIGQNREWTWSGPAASRKIQEIMKARGSGPSGAKESRTKFPSLAVPKSVQKALLPRWMRQLSNKKTSADQSAGNSADDLEAPKDIGHYSSIGAGQIPSSIFAETRNSMTRHYFTHTGAANLSDALESGNLLEETSLADFLRALTALHTRVGAVPDEYVRKPQRKMGTASLTPPKLPSLLTLFSPPSGAASATQSQQNTVTAAQNSARRFSLRTVDNSGTATPSYSRKMSFAGPAAKPRRRFSLRPVNTPASTPPQHASPYLSAHRQFAEPSNPPPYSADPFVFVSSKEPLVSMEGAPGISHPMTTSTSNLRRFSLRPAQISVPSTQATSNVDARPGGLGGFFNSKIGAVNPTKPIPRWKAGMLQRQISQMNLQRRVRAFSLSDVNSDGSNLISSTMGGPEDSSRFSGAGWQRDFLKKPLKPGSATTGKSVTIASPEASMSDDVMANRRQALTVQPDKTNQAEDSGRSMDPKKGFATSGIFNDRDAKTVGVDLSIVADRTYRTDADVDSRSTSVTSSETSSSELKSSSDSTSVIRSPEDKKLLRSHSLERSSGVQERDVQGFLEDFTAISCTSTSLEDVRIEPTLSLDSGWSELSDLNLKEKFKGGQELPMTDLEKRANDGKSVDHSEDRKESGSSLLSLASLEKLLIQYQGGKSILGESSSSSEKSGTEGNDGTFYPDASKSVETRTKDLDGPRYRPPLLETSNVDTGPSNSCDKTLMATSRAKEESRKAGETSSRELDKVERKTSVSVEPWSESQRSSARKTSMGSQLSSSAGSAASSRKSSTIRTPNDKPRVSIDCYKPLVEVKIEKPAVNPFEQYRASMAVGLENRGLLAEVKVESPNERASTSVSEPKRKEP